MGHLDLVKRYSVPHCGPFDEGLWRLGGEFITVGSGAHAPDELGRGVDAALNVLGCAGFLADDRLSRPQARGRFLQVTLTTFCAFGPLPAWTISNWTFSPTSSER